MKILILWKKFSTKYDQNTICIFMPLLNIKTLMFRFPNHLSSIINKINHVLMANYLTKPFVLATEEETDPYIS